MISDSYELLKANKDSDTNQKLKHELHKIQ